MFFWWKQEELVRLKQLPFIERFVLRVSLMLCHRYVDSTGHVWEISGGCF